MTAAPGVANDGTPASMVIAQSPDVGSGRGAQ
jgi:hypothetical protein